LKNKGELS